MADEQQPEQTPSAPTPQNSPAAAPGPRHIADEPVGEADSLGATVQSPITETGLPVEDQVRKEWDPNKNGGLPIPLRRPQ